MPTQTPEKYAKTHSNMFKEEGKTHWRWEDQQKDESSMNVYTRTAQEVSNIHSIQWFQWNANRRNMWKSKNVRKLMKLLTSASRNADWTKAVGRTNATGFASRESASVASTCRGTSKQSEGLWIHWKKHKNIHILRYSSMTPQVGGRACFLVYCFALPCLENDREKDINRTLEDFEVLSLRMIMWYPLCPFVPILLLDIVFTLDIFWPFDYLTLEISCHARCYHFKNRRKCRSAELRLLKERSAWRPSQTPRWQACSKSYKGSLDIQSEMWWNLTLDITDSCSDKEHMQTGRWEERQKYLGDC